MVVRTGLEDFSAIPSVMAAMSDTSEHGVWFAMPPLPEGLSYDSR